MRLFIIVFCGWPLLGLAAVSDPLVRASEYYYRNQAYSESLEIWNTISRQNPKQLGAFLSVLELTLWQEGRAALDQRLKEWLEKRGRLGPAERLALSKKLSELQSLFVTDLGQAKFLLAQTPIEQGDWDLALQLLEESAAAERGNILVLFEKARCEKERERWDSYYQTLQRIHSAQPFQASVLGPLAEAHVKNEYYDNAIRLIAAFPPSQRDVRTRVAFAMALLESQQPERARSHFESLLQTERLLPAQRAVVYYGMGQSIYKDKRRRAEALRYLKEFTELATELPETKWDPYEISDRLRKSLLLIVRPRS